MSYTLLISNIYVVDEKFDGATNVITTANAKSAIDLILHNSMQNINPEYCVPKRIIADIRLSELDEFFMFLKLFYQKNKIAGKPNIEYRGFLDKNIPNKDIIKEVESLFEDDCTFYVC